MENPVTPQPPATPQTLTATVAPKPSSRIEVLDFVRGIAIIHIILYHYFLEWFHGGFLILPNGIMANISQLTMFHDGGVLGFVKNIFGALWAYGFFSVNLFLALSGFVLTYSALRSNLEFHGISDLAMFYWKKLKRIIIPLYVSILAGIGFLYLRNFLFPTFGAAPIFTWIDGLKLLFPPFLVFDIPLLQKFNGDLWFITLILQLYILFPLLQYLLKKLGAWKFIALTLSLTLVYRFIATYYLSAAPMGVLAPSQSGYIPFSFFLPRLAEFSAGMALAYLYTANNKILETITGFGGFALGVVISLFGFSLDMYQWGWTFADFVVSIGLFLVFINLGEFLSRLSLLKGWILKLSDVSYDVYLIHHYFLNYFLAPLILVWGVHQESTFWIVMPIFVVGSIILGWIEAQIANRVG